MNDIIAILVRGAFFLFIAVVVINLLIQLIAGLANKFRRFIGTAAICTGVVMANVLLGTYVSEGVLLLTIPASIYIIYVVVKY